MLDFIFVAALAAVCTVAVRRVRRLGFAGLRPELGISLSRARSFLDDFRVPRSTDEGLVEAEGAEEPGSPIEPLPVGPVPARAPEAAPLVTPASEAATLAAPAPRALPRRRARRRAFPFPARVAVAVVGGLALITVAVLAVLNAGIGQSGHQLEDASLSAGRELIPPGAIKQPRGIAASPDGTLFVADADSKAIVMLSANPQEPRFLLEGELQEPAAVAYAPDGNILVVDGGAGAILRVDPREGSVLGRIGADVGLYGPRGIAAGTDGRVAVADTGNNRVVVFPRGGGQPEFLTGLREPTDVAFLSDGGFVVAATGERRIVTVKPGGERTGSWDIPVAYTVVGPHVLALPGGGLIATTPEEGALLRIAADRNRYQRVNLEGSKRKPVGIAASPLGIVVTDGEGGRVTLYEDLAPLR